jgi:hypothetical protein
LQGFLFGTLVAYLVGMSNTNKTNWSIENMLEKATEIREAIPYLENLPADTAEIAEALILRLELAQARKVNQGVREREAVAARRAGKLAAIEAAEAKAKAPKGKRRGRDLSVDLGEGHHAEIKPGLSIRLHGVETKRRHGPVSYDKTYQIGDTVAMDSYNLIYMGQIVSIGAKTVTIKGNLGTKRLNLERFSWFNRLFDVEATARRNAEERYYL